MAVNEIDQLIREKRLYFVGEKLPSDWYEAFRLWLPMAESGDAKAQFNIGRCYSLGDGVDEDQTKSVEWLMKAASQDEPRAHFNLYLRYKEIKDEEKAAGWLTKATELGEPRALVESGKKALGSGNRDQARILYKRAVDLGCEVPELELAACDIYIENFKIMWNWAGPAGGWIFCYTIQNKSPIPIFVQVIAQPCIADNPDKLYGDKLYCPTHFIEPDLQVAAHDSISKDKDKNVAVLGFTLWSADAKKERIYRSEEYFAFEKNVYVKAKGKCFVLTACYGDYDAPTVMQYRHFRDNYLEKNEYGRKFIAWYYIHGPKWAEKIEKMPRTKAVFRGFFKLLSYLLPH